MAQSKLLAALTKRKAVWENMVSRGLHIPQVDLFLNNDIFKNGKNYAHRIGRTARGERADKALHLGSQYNLHIDSAVEKLIGWSTAANYSVAKHSKRPCGRVRKLCALAGSTDDAAANATTASILACIANFAFSADYVTPIRDYDFLRAIARTASYPSQLMTIVQSL